MEIGGLDYFGRSNSSEASSTIFANDLTPKDYAISSQELDSDLTGQMKKLEFDFGYLPGGEPLKTVKQLQALMDIAFYGRDFARAHAQWRIETRNQQPIDVDKLLAGNLVFDGSLAVHLKLLGNLVVGKGKDRLLAAVESLGPEDRQEAMLGILRSARKLIDKLASEQKKSLSRGNIRSASHVLTQLEQARKKYYDSLKDQASQEQVTDPATLVRIGIEWD